DPHVVDTGLHEAGGAGVGGLDPDADRLAGEAADVGGGRRPGGGVGGGGAQLLEHDRGGAAHHGDAQEVGAARVVEVREVVAERQRQGAAGRQRDRRRGDAGGA